MQCGSCPVRARDFERSEVVAKGWLVCVCRVSFKCVVYVGDLGQMMGSVMLVNKEKSVSEP